MKKFVWLLVIGVLAPLSAAMAQGSVRGKIVDETTGEPVEFVNIVLTHKGNNNMAGGTITDAQGSFRIDDLAYGSYVLTVSYIGYQNATREFTLSATAKNAHFKQITISEDNQMLKEIEVTGIRSQMKFEIDKKVFNVDQAIAATGGSASDILQNIPSVEVDTEGTVSLRGSESVTVWINGKAQGLTADNQGDILEQMPAESIERIEVITNPSAKYSPEGTVGIINIVLKRDRKAGYYGSAQVGASMYDLDFGGYNASANINYSSGKLDAYANISYRERHHRNENTSYRENYMMSGDTTYLDQLGYGNMNGRNMFARTGLTWHVTEKDHLSLDLMGMMGSPRRTNVIDYTGGQVVGGIQQQDYTRNRTTTSSGQMLMYNLSLGYKHEWSTTHWLDFTASRHHWGNDNDNIYLDSTYVNVPSESSQHVPSYGSYQEQVGAMSSIDYEVQLDYENAFNDNHKLQAGYRGTFTRENNPTTTYGAPNQQDEIASLYNRFIYNRDLHALYATYSGKLWKNFGYQVGLRGEYYKVSTNSYSKDVAGGDEIPHFEPLKPEFQLFPSIFLSYQLPNDNELQVNYTKRVRRPWGGQLNSFQNISDSTNISFGNPLLRPEYSNAFEFNYLKSWENHMLSVSAYYRTTDDIMQRVSYMDNGIMYNTSYNVTQSLASGVEIVGKNRFFGKLDITTTINMYYYKLNGFDFPIPGKEDAPTLHGDASEDFSWNIRMMGTLGLPKAWSLQVTGMYNAKSVIAQGYRAPNYGLDAGVRKQFAGGKWSLSLNGRDLLNSRRFHSVKWGPDFYQDSSNFRGGRQISATLTYSFGNMRAKKPRKMDNGGMQPEYGGGDGLEYDM